MFDQSPPRKSARSGFAYWNPFRKLDTRREAVTAAKAGAFVAGYVVFSYGVQVALILFTGRNAYGNGGAVMLIVNGAILALFAFVVWRIWTRQTFWACLLAALWYVGELGFQVAAVMSGAAKASGAYFTVFLALAICAVLGVRGSWKLRRLTPDDPPAAT